MENTTKGLGILEKILNLIRNYRLWDFFKAFMVMGMLGLMTFAITNPDKVFDYFSKAGKKTHDTLIEQRMENTHKIQQSIDRLMFKTGASRCLIISLHNGLNDINNVPYMRGSAIYESIDDGIYPVSDQYQDVMLSLLPFATHLYYNDYWCGNVDDLIEIDKTLYHRLSSNQATHFCATTIQGTEKPIGFIFLTYTFPPEHNCDEIKKEVQHTSLEVALLMNINRKKS